MNLISCGCCGVVIDVDRISGDLPKMREFKEEVDEESTKYNRENFYWDGDDYSPAMKCPVCNMKISAVDGDHVP
jgi:hypothetical protein